VKNKIIDDTLTAVPFTESEIDAAEKLNACSPAIKWLRAKPRTLAQLAAHRQDWACWIVGRVPDYAERVAAALLARPGGAGEYSLCRVLERVPAYSERAWSALLALPGGAGEYSLCRVLERIPDYSERAWAALLSRPGGVSEDGLRWILEYIPAYSERAAAELRRRKRTKPLNRKAREKK